MYLILLPCFMIEIPHARPYYGLVCSSSGGERRFTTLAPDRSTAGRSGSISCFVHSIACSSV